MLTSPQRYRTLAASTGILLCAVIAFLWGSGREQRTEYQGKPLSYWFNQLPLTETQPGWHSVIKTFSLGNLKYGSFQEKPEKAQEAICAIGTNALPFLFAKLEQPDSPIQRRIQSFASGIGIKHRFFSLPMAERWQAVTALVYLRPLPDQSVRQLLALSTNADRRVADAASYVVTAPKHASPPSKAGFRPE